MIWIELSSGAKLFVPDMDVDDCMKLLAARADMNGWVWGIGSFSTQMENAALDRDLDLDTGFDFNEIVRVYGTRPR